MRILPWVALGCAFGPVLVQLADAIPEVPFGWSVLLAPVLMCAAALRCERKTQPGERKTQPRRSWAPVLLIAGLLVELAGLAGGSPGIARLGLPISVVGLSLWTGAPRLMTALLVLWAIPIPGTLYGRPLRISNLRMRAWAPEIANFWLDHGVWLLTAILGVVWIETRGV